MSIRKFSKQDTSACVDWSKLPECPDAQALVGPPIITNIIISIHLRYENDPERKVLLDVDAISLNMPDCANLPDSWYAVVIRSHIGVTMSVFRSGCTTCACVGSSIVDARRRIDMVVATMNDNLPPHLPRVVVDRSQVSNIMMMISTSHETNMALLKRSIKSFRHEPEVSPQIVYQPFGKQSVFFNFFSKGNHVIGNCKDQADIDAAVAFVTPLLLRTCVLRDVNSKFSVPIGSRIVGLPTPTTPPAAAQHARSCDSPQPKRTQPQQPMAWVPSAWAPPTAPEKIHWELSPEVSAIFD